MGCRVSLCSRKKEQTSKGHAAVPVPPYPQGVEAFEWNGAHGGTDAGPERDTLCAGRSLINPDPKKQSRHLWFWTPYDRSYRHFDLRPAIILEVSCRFTVNPVPRTYLPVGRQTGARGFGALPLQGGRNIHPVPTVLDRGRIGLSRRSWNEVHPRAYARGILWYGVKAALWRGLMLIREYFTSGIISDRG